MTPLHRTRAVSEAQTILGVANGASEREIHSAWKKLAFRLHPDRGAADTGELASVNAAYTLLKTKMSARTAAAPEPAPRPANTGAAPVRPRKLRPSVPTRVTRISDEMQAACAKLVEAEPKGHGHVACRIERAGRRITYVVENGLAEGVNRVAMPVSDYGNGIKPGPNSIAFRATRSGSGTLDLPEAIRERVFPGMTSVRVKFTG